MTSITDYSCCQTRLRECTHAKGYMQQLLSQYAADIRHNEVFSTCGHLHAANRRTWNLLQFVAENNYDLTTLDGNVFVRDEDLTEKWDNVFYQLVTHCKTPGAPCSLIFPDITDTFASSTSQPLNIQLGFNTGYRVYNNRHPGHVQEWIEWQKAYTDQPNSFDHTHVVRQSYKEDEGKYEFSDHNLKSKLAELQLPDHHDFYAEKKFGGCIIGDNHVQFNLLLPEAVDQDKIRWLGKGQPGPLGPLTLEGLKQMRRNGWITENNSALIADIAKEFVMAYWEATRGAIVECDKILLTISAQTPLKAPRILGTEFTCPTIALNWKPTDEDDGWSGLNTEIWTFCTEQGTD